MKKKFLALGLLIVIVASMGINLYLTSTVEKSSDQEKTIKINLTIGFGSSDVSSNVKNKVIEISNTTSVFDALNKVAGVKYAEFGGMGKMITSIDNVTQNSSNYWIYFVNGNFAGVAADKYVLLADSTVFFKYASSEEAMNYFK